MSQRDMLIVQLKDSRKKAFLNGFWRGMAAPLLLYSTVTLPKEVGDVEFQALPRQDLGGQNDDLRKIGSDIRTAFDRVAVQRG